MIALNKERLVIKLFIHNYFFRFLHFYYVPEPVHGNGNTSLEKIYECSCLQRAERLRGPALYTSSYHVMYWMAINTAREASEGVLISAWVPGRASWRCWGEDMRRGDRNEEIGRERSGRERSSHAWTLRQKHSLDATWRKEPCVRPRMCAGKCVAEICWHGKVLQFKGTGSYGGSR